MGLEQQPFADRRIQPPPPGLTVPLEIATTLKQQGPALEVMPKEKRKDFLGQLRKRVEALPEGQRGLSLKYLTVIERAAKLAALYRDQGPNFSDNRWKEQDEELWSHACFLAAALPEEENQLFWESLRRQLQRGRQLDDRRLTAEGFDQKRRGAMAEYAVGLAIAEQRWPDLDYVEKTTPRQDVAFGRDLTVSLNSQSIPIQVKLIGGTFDGVEIWDRVDEKEWQPIVHIWLHYDQDFRIYFNEENGQPTDRLLEALDDPLAKVLRKVGSGERLYVKRPA